MTTSEPIVFADPQLLTRDRLRAILAALPSDPLHDGYEVTTRAPSPDDAAPRGVFVRVGTLDAGRDSRLNGEGLVRVQVYHRDAGLAVRLASHLEARLLADRHGSHRGYSPVTGPIPTSDPDNGAPLAFFTITARLRPAHIS